MPKRLMGPFNINEIVRFKPTPLGITKMKLRLFHNQCTWYKIPDMDADGYMQVPFWELARELGDCFYVGAPNVIENNSFVLVLEN